MNAIETMACAWRKEYDKWIVEGAWEGPNHVIRECGQKQPCNTLADARRVMDLACMRAAVRALMECETSHRVDEAYANVVYSIDNLAADALRAMLAALLEE